MRSFRRHVLTRDIHPRLTLRGGFAAFRRLRLFLTLRGFPSVRQGLRAAGGVAFSFPMLSMRLRRAAFRGVRFRFASASACNVLYSPVFCCGGRRGYQLSRFAIQAAGAVFVLRRFTASACFGVSRLRRRSRCRLSAAGLYRFQGSA